MKNLNRQSTEGLRATLKDITVGLTTFSENADKDSLLLLVQTIAEALDDLDQDDFFGTEGWVHAFNMD